MARDASYTTQPVELLNALGFENSKNHSVSSRDFEISTSDVPSLKSDENEAIGHHQRMVNDVGDTYALASPDIGMDGIIKNPITPVLLDHNQETVQAIDLDGSEG